MNTTLLHTLIAMLNSLWQGALVAALVWVGLKFAPRINAATRYVIWWVVLALVLLLPAATSVAAWFRPTTHFSPTFVGQVANLRPVANRPSDAPPAIVTFTEPRSPQWPLSIAGLWAAVFLYRATQIARSYLYLRGIKRRAQISPEPLPAIERRASLLLSSEIASPMAVGFLKPAVIVPKSLPQELERPEMDHVLLHESAHIARLDDWTNLFLRLLGAITAFHPVAVWILRQIEREREVACDDWVVAHTGGARQYAASLARMFELRWSGRRDLLAAGIFGSGSRIGDRIEMLLRRGRDFSPRASRKRVAAIAIMLLALAGAGSLAPRWIAFAQQPAQVQTQAQAQTPAPSPAPAPGKQTPAPTAQQAQEKNSGGWLAEIEAAGLRDLDVDRLIAMKMAGVTGDYIRQMRAAGFQLNEDQLVAFRMHGVTTDFANEMRKSGLGELNPDQLIAFRIHGVEPSFVQQVRSLGYPNVTADQIVSLRVSGVTIDFIREAQRHFKNLTIDQLVQLSMLGILKPGRTV